MTHAALRPQEELGEDVPVFVRPARQTVGRLAPLTTAALAFAAKQRARLGAASSPKRGALAVAALVPLVWGLGVALPLTPEARASEAPPLETSAGGAFQAASAASQAGAQPVAAKPVAFPAARHTAVAGDSWAALAERYGVSVRSLKAVNAPAAEPKPGRVLLVPPTEGVLHPLAAGETLLLLASRYQVSLKALQEANPGLRSDRLQIDQPIFVPGATALKPTPAQLSRAGRPGHAVRTASRGLAGAASRIGRFSAPAPGYFSSGFGHRGSHFHSGMDICNAVGTPIRAARDGRVLSAGWAGAYGYAVDIDHGGGVVTRYAHCSKLLCVPGAQVERGEVIASMGSTGRSTAPHVHFEVRVNGRPLDPSGLL